MAGGTVIGRDSRFWHFALSGLTGALALAAGLVASGSARAGVTQYSLESIGEFDNPVYVDDDGVNDNLAFVVEQGGRIQVVRDGAALDKPFLDIDEFVVSGGEEGLLSVAFDPDYADNGRFYVYYVNGNHDIRVDQFERKKATRARVSSRRKVIVVEHNQADNHNGGQLQTGPDGLLYLATGDGGPQGDPENDAQRTNSLLGKVLRIDPKAKGGYEIPDDNPYADGPGKDEIYALGLRNPYRFSFDSGNGALTIGDVGGSAWEEVDYVVDPQPGMNFGWNDYEGLEETGFGTGDNADPKVDPIHVYSHADSNCAVTGGFVVHDPGLPTLAGQYVFADYCEDGLRTLQVPSGAAGASLNLQPSNVSGFGEGFGGQIYVVSRSGDVATLEESSP